MIKRTKSMKLCRPEALINGAIVLTIGFFAAGCGFLALPTEELSPMEEYEIYQSLYGDWYLSYSCLPISHFATPVRSTAVNLYSSVRHSPQLQLDCIVFSEEESPEILSFFENGYIKITTWDEEGWSNEYTSSYSLGIGWEEGSPFTTLRVPDRFNHLIIRTKDQLLLRYIHDDRFRYEYSRIE